MVTLLTEAAVLDGKLDLDPPVDRAWEIPSGGGLHGGVSARQAQGLLACRPGPQRHATAAAIAVRLGSWIWRRQVPEVHAGCHVLATHQIPRVVPAVSRRGRAEVGRLRSRQQELCRMESEEAPAPDVLPASDQHAAVGLLRPI